ncbi:hypothetical protein TEQUI_0406 [Taylorella equigenitalis MCE9]|uniref:Uncharacterized protein n=1 Tax=Taylorella equigenitalis (strain MCE9) TaxID=937774 RepID=A0A654KG19_TAYEM|nr:hypothetical protein TEQUI_0406 [Taylorella equigenitalis MCE9]
MAVIAGGAVVAVAVAVEDVDVVVVVVVGGAEIEAVHKLHPPVFGFRQLMHVAKSEEHFEAH